MNWLRKLFGIGEKRPRLDVTSLPEWFEPGTGYDVHGQAKIAAVEVKPGDTFVLMSDQYLSENARREIKAWWDSDKNPLHSHKVLVIDAGMKLHLVRQETLGMTTEDAARAGEIEIQKAPDRV